jgi:voltage-gated potassium channel
LPLLTLFMVVIAGAIESLVNNDDFPTTWDGIWWAVVTVTTVGYGDVYPNVHRGADHREGGLLFGIGFLSVLTAAIASRFVKTERADETEEILAALGRLEGELAELKQHVVGSPEPPASPSGTARIT